jgi:hypothetical protein
MGDARKKGSMSLAEHIWYVNTANWFHENLNYPSCFDQPVLSNIRFEAQCWFKYKNSLHLEKTISVAKLLRKHGIGVSVRLTADPGKVIYEDLLQVVVLPSP